MSMQNYRSFIRKSLESIEAEIPFSVKMAFPKSRAEGNVVSYFELHNTSTAAACIDDIGFQIDLWFDEIDALFEMAQLVDKKMLGIGFLRQFSSPDSMLNDPSGYYRKTFRYGRQVDTVTNRLIDY